MPIQHFDTYPSPDKRQNYTRTGGTPLYKKSIEIREYVLYLLTERTVPVFKKFGKPKDSGWRITIKQLAGYPDGSLGKAWHDFYQDQPFGITNNYERHDIMHVLLQYRTSIIEETRMYAFLFGNGKRSIPTLFTLAIGSVILSEFIPIFYKDYLRGKSVRRFIKWDFRYLLREDIDGLRRFVFKIK